MITEKLTAYLRSPKHEQLKGWTKLLTLSGAAQIIVQAIGLLSGIIIIRILPTKEYALYTIVNAMLGTMTVLSDGGITTGVMAQGGKVWQDRNRLGGVMVTGYALRKQFSIFSILVAVPLLAYLMYNQGASWLNIVLIILSLIPAFLAALSDSLLEICLKLQQDIKGLQKNQVIVAVFKLVAMAILYFSPIAFVAIILTGMPRIWGNIKLKKLTEKYVNWKMPVNVEEKENIVKVVRRVLPGAVYYAFSGQITTWLISIFGNSSSVAQIGALSKITVLLTIFTSVFGTIIIPRFSRLPSNKELLFKRYFQIMAGLILVCLFVITITWLYAPLILMILGRQYAMLHGELVLSMTGAIIALLSGASFMLISGRGWVLNPIVTIIINIIAIIVGIVAFDVSSLHGILIFNIFVSSVQALRAIVYGVIAINSSANYN